MLSWEERPDIVNPPKECLSSPKSFIQYWLTSKRLPAFDRVVDVYPDETKCPKDVYNLWTTFTYDLKEHQGPYAPDLKGLAFWLEHVYALLDRDDASSTDRELASVTRPLQSPGAKREIGALPLDLRIRLGSEKRASYGKSFHAQTLSMT